MKDPDWGALKAPPKRDSGLDPNVHLVSLATDVVVETRPVSPQRGWGVKISSL